jgi:hypothetical protein
VDIDEVRRVIRECAGGQRNPVKAVTFRQKYGSASKPVLMRCDDNRDYVLKGSHNGRRLVADHFVGRLGQLMGAPVGQIVFGFIPSELIALEPQLADVGAGICHATLWVPDCTDRQGIDHMNQPYNRDRFALLQVLYSLALASDHQLIYAKSAPFLVHSVDHGHFLNGGTGWTADTLRQIGPVTVDPYFRACGLPDAALAAAKPRLAEITDDDLRMIAAGLPDEWKVTAEDRSALVEYFVARRDRLLALLP